MNNVGTIALLGSGETSSQGRKIHDYLLSRLGPPPVCVTLLETTAGFQPNVGDVYGKIGEFFEKSLQNFKPEIEYVAALRKGTADDPDSHDVVKGLLNARYIFSGPGSPTYAARQLRHSLAVDYMVASYKGGATMTLSSAAALAAGSHVMRVYEIFKAGNDLGWDPGLSIMGALGLGVDPVIVIHWNNAEGGAGLDTTHCYVGRERFDLLLRMLPVGTAVMGIDEHTACILESGSEEFRVMGAGTVTVMRSEGETLRVIPAGETFPLALLKSAVASQHEADLMTMA